MKKFFLVAIAISLTLFVQAQHLKPGFDKAEYKELMLISVRTVAVSNYYNQFPEPQNFKMVYQSQTMGFDNLWDLWTSKDSVAVISVRGTTAKAVSWLPNVYAAMVPAKGEIQLNDSSKFVYELSSHPQAAVHVGWLLCTAILSRDMLPKIDSSYKKGVKEFLIMGHSQGGAIAYLLTAYLYSLQRHGALPADIRFKTYCSAGPKPGNLYFAYEYERLTQKGWAYNVVNSADWVSETPVSVQSEDDFNFTNPFRGAKQNIRKQKFPNDLALMYAYNKLTKPTNKARKNYEKFLGGFMCKQVQKLMPQYKEPEYFHSTDYVRTGNIITLYADEEYYKIFSNGDKNVFEHHFHKPYLYLLERW